MVWHMLMNAMIGGSALKNFERVDAGGGNCKLIVTQKLYSKQNQPTLMKLIGIIM